MLFYLFQCTKQQIKIKYNSQETSLSKNFDIFYLREDGVFGGWIYGCLGIDYKESSLILFMRSKEYCVL